VITAVTVADRRRPPSPIQGVHHAVAADTTTREPGAGAELLLVAAGATVLGVGVVVWLGARLAVAVAGGGQVAGGISDWLTVATRLARGESPAQAWGPLAAGLPAAWLYWTCTILVAAAAVALVTALVVMWRRFDRAVGGRRRFGQRTEAHEATHRDVAPLAVRSLQPPTGRMLLGRMMPGGPLLATEDRDRHPLKARRARRQGNRGSVALIGPTGSGKTALAASAIATWDGPVVAVSVKRDLYDTTATARAERGELAMFDPGMATGLSTARWSPLEAVTTSSGALRTGRALAQAIPRSGVTNADYWAKHGETLLSAFMGVAGLSRLLAAPHGQPPYPTVNMEHIATWVTTMADASDPTINRILKSGLDKRQPLEVKLIARHASVNFVGVAKEDHKIRSSIYSTASHAINPWLEPSVAHSATADPRHSYNSTEAWDKRPRFIDLEWLMGGEPGTANTLYLTAQQPEFERLSPVLGGLLADLKDTIHAWDIAGRRLDKPLLILIDEAGQLELGWLPAEVSTIAALGAFFVTCWQNLSQIQHRYSTLADAVLSGHRTKCFFAGVDDLTTTRYLTNLLGSEYVTRLSTSRDLPALLGGHGHGRRSVSHAEQRVDFAPANTVREMEPGQAVLLHGTLPPIHLEAVRWWREKQLAALVPLDDAGNPTPPPDLATCPLGTEAPAAQTPLVDEATLVSTLAELPAVNRRHDRVKKQRAGAAQLPFDDDTPADAAADTSQPTTATRRTACVDCGVIIRAGEGRLTTDNTGHTVARCHPTCVTAQSGRPNSTESPSPPGQPPSTSSEEP
jgi:type IV secretion system protein VirD4